MNLKFLPKPTLLRSNRIALFPFFFLLSCFLSVFSLVWSRSFLGRVASNEGLKKRDMKRLVSSFAYAPGFELCSRIQWILQVYLADDSQTLQCLFSEFEAVGDGKTLNTLAFQNAIFYLRPFVDKGGAQLYVPPGRWLIGCINLTSHLTLFLEKDVVLLATQDYSCWDVVGPLPSYGRGLEIPGNRYGSFITGHNFN